MVPDDWKTASLPHRYSSYKVSWFKRMHLCICGASGFSLQALQQAHYRIEMETRAWLDQIYQGQQRQQKTRQDNLAKYEEFKKSLQQNSSPDSANFYQ